MPWLSIFSSEKFFRRFVTVCYTKRAIALIINEMHITLIISVLQRCIHPINKSPFLPPRLDNINCAFRKLF